MPTFQVERRRVHDVASSDASLSARNSGAAHFPSTATHPSLFTKPMSPPSPTSGSRPIKRVAKACASCRKDKIRCDGERPCGGCLKKGYNPSDCTDGCDSCRRARARCEGGKPCNRCQEENLSCADDSTTTTSPASSPREQPGQPTPFLVMRARTKSGERAKLACRSCRRDNKKCEDKRPCSRCISRAEECIHVERGPKLVKLRCEGCRQDNFRCQDFRPCEHCTEKGIECVDVPRKERGYGSRVKAACITCRRDKVRCDGFRPCSQCVRKSVDCLDRACKTCTKAGLDCVHRGMSEKQASPSEDDEQYHENAPAFSSLPQPLPSPTVSSNGGTDSRPYQAQFYYDLYSLSSQSNQQHMIGPGVSHAAGSIPPSQSYPPDGMTTAMYYSTPRMHDRTATAPLSSFLRKTPSPEGSSAIRRDTKSN